MQRPTAVASRGHGFGTAPVFLAAISTILGAILFLRFGWAVGNVGVLGAIGIVLVAHLITIPTGLAVAEIATNLKVEGGGEYYIVSRSFGTTVGGAIGLSLFLSQAISVAFYMIAFSEAFRPLFGWVLERTGFELDTRMISLPAAGLLLLLILRKGADLGVNALWVVVGILTLSLGLFFLGQPSDAPTTFDLLAKVDEPERFSKVFAIVFPAFTGMTAGVGLSGDLRNPRRSIPLGTIAATLTGMVVYILIVLKLGFSASPERLDSDTFAMGHIALWGPAIPIGLAAATISSAIGSILVAPRTLQALAADDILPVKGVNRFLARGRGGANEPFNATLITAAIVIAFVSAGSVDFVAQIISMFFMVTYGALCAISFLQHFSGNPSYRPTFRSRWYLSGLGAVACVMMMWEMSPLYTVLAWGTMVGIYVWLRASRKGAQDVSVMVQGAAQQLVRSLHVLLQKQRTAQRQTQWRPSFLAISRHSFTRLAPFDLLRWLSQHYGFGTFFHFIEGRLDHETSRDAQEVLQRLVGQSKASHASMYVDTIVSPSFHTAVAQMVQIPGISGMDNNSILFEFRKGNDEELMDILVGSSFAQVAGLNVCVLRSSDHHFGYRRRIHIWLTHGDYRNANLMILLAYILAGHPEWGGAEIRLFAAFDDVSLEDGIETLNALIAEGRIPISRANVQPVPMRGDVTFSDLVCAESEQADLVITGFSISRMARDGGAFLQSFASIQDVLFVRAGEEILITDDSAPGSVTEVIEELAEPAQDEDQAPDTA
jgi:amino acid transporter